MVLIYLDGGFEEESSRKKFGTGFLDAFWGPTNYKNEVDLYNGGLFWESVLPEMSGHFPSTCSR